MFGELVFDSSRAVSDDEDDDYAIQNEEFMITKRDLFWFDNIPSSLNVDQIILAYDPLSAAFIQSFLLDHHENKQFLGTISTQAQYKAECRHLNKTKPTFMGTNHLILLNFNSKSYLIIQCYNKILADEAADILNKLFSRVTFGSVFSLTSEHVSNYYGQYHKVPFVKYLSNLQIQSCSKLDAPNFLTGFPAALSQTCFTQNKPFVSFICYKSTIEIDLNSLTEINEVVSQVFDRGLLIVSLATKNYITIYKQDSLNKRMTKKLRNQWLTISNQRH